MKDELLVIVDAIRQAKAEINAYQAAPVKDAPGTLKRIEAVLFDQRVSEAMGLLVPALADAPSVVPGETGPAAKVFEGTPSDKF